MISPQTRSPGTLSTGNVSTSIGTGVFLALLCSACDASSAASNLADASAPATGEPADSGSARDGHAGPGQEEDAGDVDAARTDPGAPVDASLAQDAGGPVSPSACPPGGAGNPFVEGWYADPDMQVYDGVYWLYPTYSAPYEQQTHLDAFSSRDLVHWQKHARVLERENVSWATRAMWAPSPIRRNGKYYLYFGANDIQNDAQLGGIGVAVADAPEGPFVDALGRPLIDAFHNGAQPIDQNAFVDDDGQAYLYYGGWGHCNVAKLNEDMVSLGRFDDGSAFKEVTPSGYVEGALMFKRNGTYYFMWSEGGWTGPDYRVSYAMASSPLGPFERLGTLLSQNAAIGTGSGHNTVVNVPGSDDWYMLYHRHPLGETDGNHRVLAYDRLLFRADGTIAPVAMSSRDDFCDDNAIGWSPLGGTWAVNERGYEVTSEGESKSLMNTNWQALRMAASVQVGETGHAGVLFRVSAASGGTHGYRGYYAGIDAGASKLFVGRSDGGSYVELAAAARNLEPARPHLLEVVASGTRLEVFLDGASTPDLTVSDAAHASGKTGLLAHDTYARFDDVSVVPPPGASFYQDGGFGGAAVSLPPGDYRLAQLQAAGIPNDWASSVRVPEGYRVQMFEHDEFGGQSWTFSADAGSLPAEANDQMSSVKISAL